MVFMAGVSFDLKTHETLKEVPLLHNFKAYLSLPEGTASVDGLIAMMTDHYSVMGGSDSEREGNDASGFPRKSQKRGRGKVRGSISKEDHLKSQPVASSDGCLSLLKRKHSDGRAVGKRTPRFPVSYLLKKDDREIYISPNKRVWKPELIANDDEGAHVAALALTEASQRGGSPHVSQTPYRRTDYVKTSPIRSRERMRCQSEVAQAEICGTETDEDCLEGSLESRGAENGDFSRDSIIEGVGTVEIHQMGKKFYGKKDKVEDIVNNQFDDIREACSGTEEGLDLIDVEVTNANRYSPHGQRKKSKKLFFGDESSAFEALNTLADLSLMIPSPTIESESSVPAKEGKTTLDVADKSSVVEAISSSHKTRLSGSRDKVLNSISGAELTTSRKSKLGRDLTFDMNALPEVKQQSQLNKVLKRRRNSLVSKTSKAEVGFDSRVSEPLMSTALTEEENKSLIKGNHSSSAVDLLKQWNPVKPPERSFSNSDQKSAGTDVAVSMVHIRSTNQLSLPTRQRTRRKMNPQKTLIQKEMESSDRTIKDQATKYFTSFHDKALCPKEKLSSCLSSYMVRRWCAFEWFYSAIDYPWFAKREFVEYLNHVGLGHIPRLTRVEWGVIRSSLGKPRRFSERFLQEEKEKLRQYRESVRTHYTKLRAGIGEGLPTDLARPLTVGQRVIALHPKTREVYDGSVLTVDHDRCRVQFDHTEIGVEFVMDIDCMPLNPTQNMPDNLRRRNISVNRFSVGFEGPKVNGQSYVGRSVVFDASECLDNVPVQSYISSSNHHVNALIQHTKGEVHAVSQAKVANIDIIKHPQQVARSQQVAHSQPCMVAEIQAREAERALSGLTHALDTKVSSAVVNMRQRNTHPGNLLPPWLKPPPVLDDRVAPTSSADNSSLNSQESESNVVEIVKGSRFRAQTMVDVAKKAMSSIKEGEDAFVKIGEALSKLQVMSDSEVSVMASLDPVNGNQLNSEPLVTGHHLYNNDACRDETQIPSDLISSCVATLLMIQWCTERQYPPADVAQILDLAVTNLHPRCPQNLPIYREIQMCMGRIKTQILALIPT